MLSIRANMTLAFIARITRDRVKATSLPALCLRAYSTASVKHAHKVVDYTVDKFPGYARNMTFKTVDDRCFLTL